MYNIFCVAANDKTRNKERELEGGRRLFEESRKDASN